MKYECPSCTLVWKDEKEPLELYCYPLCHFCSAPHSQKELLNWQMNHLNDLNPDKSNKLLSHFYRYIELELTILKEMIYEKYSSKSPNS